MAKASETAPVGRDLTPEEVADYNRHLEVGAPLPEKYQRVVTENHNGSFAMRFPSADEARDADARVAKAAKAAEDEQAALDALRKAHDFAPPVLPE